MARDAARNRQRHTADEAPNLPLLLASLGASWLGFLLFPLGLLVELPCFVILTGRGSRLAKWCLLGSSYLVVACCIAVYVSIGYCTGNARLLVIGDGWGQANLDPRLRCHSDYTGGWCTPLPNPIAFPAFINNSMLQVICAVAGPVHGTYHGTYPDERAAQATLARQGVPVEQAEFEEGRIRLGQKTIRLTAETVKVLNEPSYAASEPPVRPAESQRAALINGECVVLQGYSCLVFNSYRPRIALIDARTGELFATYWLEGKSAPAAPYPAESAPAKISQL